MTNDLFHMGALSQRGVSFAHRSRSAQKKLEGSQEDSENRKISEDFTNLKP